MLILLRNSILVLKAITKFQSWLVFISSPGFNAAGKLMKTNKCTESLKPDLNFFSTCFERNGNRRLIGRSYHKNIAKSVGLGRMKKVSVYFSHYKTA